MTLRLRLSLAFVLVVVVPLLVGVALVARAGPRILDESASNRLGASRAGAAALLREHCTAVRLAAEVLGREAVAANAGGAVTEVITRDLATYAVVAGPKGAVTATSGSLGGGTPGPDSLGSCSRREPPAAGAPVIADSVELRSPSGALLGRAGAAITLDTELVTQLARDIGADVTLAADGQVLASTLPADDARALAERVTRLRTGPEAVRVGELLATVAPSVPGLPAVVVSVRPATFGGLEEVLAAVVLAALLLAALIGWQLARVTTRPLAELSQAAARVAGGDLQTRIQSHGRDEVGRLAVAFDEMTDKLQAHISALETSRDELRRNLGRLGDTLSSTHDLNGILAVILDTAMASIRAQAGAVLLTGQGRGALHLKASRGLRERNVATTLSVPFGEGVSGRVAATGVPICGRIGDEGVEPTPEEPRAHSVVSVPLRPSGSVLGVLNLYDKEDADNFDVADVETLRSFANGAAIAVENVLLHQEAQRLSITDGLTGLWNYRYFQMTLGKEIERAARFGRPLALLMLDIDHFKSVNDDHGHQRGDVVLVELAERVRSQIREVDVLARYGGEELVLILPETDGDGAAHIAERVWDVVRREPFGADGEIRLAVTVSIGVAVFPVHGTTAEELVRAADDALYDAKRGGRDRWRLAPSPGADAG